MMGSRTTYYFGLSIKMFWFLNMVCFYFTLSLRAHQYAKSDFYFPHDILWMIFKGIWMFMVTTLGLSCSEAALTKEKSLGNVWGDFWA